MTPPTIRHTESLLRDTGVQAKDLAQNALDQGQDLAHTALDQGQDLAKSALDHGQELTGELNGRARQVPHEVARRTRGLSGWVYTRRRPLTYLALGLTVSIVVVGVARLAMSSKSGDARGADDDRHAPLESDDGPLSQRAHDAESAYPGNDQPTVEPTDEGERIQRGADAKPGDKPAKVKTGDVIPSGTKE